MPLPLRFSKSSHSLHRTFRLQFLEHATPAPPHHSTCPPLSFNPLHSSLPPPPLPPPPSGQDCELLDLAGRPEDLLMTVLPVPPVVIRPSVEVDAGAASNEDDLTMKLMQIVEINNILRAGVDKGLPIVNLMENWDFLQVRRGGRGEGGLTG